MSWTASCLFSSARATGQSSTRARVRRGARASRTARAMSAAGEKLRAERKRFERELASPEVIPNTPIGVDDRAHFLADSPAAQPDDSVWDDDDDANAAPAPTTPYRRPPNSKDAGALPGATATASEARPPPSPALPKPSEDFTVNIREALDAAERGLRASVIATDQMERLAASRGMKVPPRGTAGFAKPHAASPKTPVIGAAGESLSLGALGRPTEAQALASLGAEDADPEARAYLKGVLRMLYGSEDAPDPADGDEATPPSRRRGGLGDDSERENVVRRRAHSRSPGSASPSPSQVSPALSEPSPARSVEGAAEGAVDEGAVDDDAVDDDAVDDDAVDGAVLDVRGSFAFAPVNVSLDAKGVGAAAETSGDVSSASPSDGPAALPPTPGLPPTPEARRASPNEALATAAATAAATVRGSMSYAGARRSKVVDDASRAAMLGELDQLEREYARITTPPEVTSAATAISTPPRDAANAEVGSKRQRRDEAAAAAASSSASPAAADAIVPSPARSPEPTPSPYRPASRRDVIIGAGDSVPMPSFDPKPTPTPRASRNPTRISAETTSGARSVSRASVSPSGSPLEPPVREALDAMDPIKGSRSASRRTPSATTDARADEDASRARDARHKVEHLVGGAFDYDALRKVTELARGRIRTQIHSVASKPSAKPPRVGPAGAATRRDGDGDDFFEDVREAAAFGVGALDAADADESIDAFCVAMRAEVATRIVASRAGVQAEAAKMALARKYSPAAAAEKPSANPRVAAERFVAAEAKQKAARGEHRAAYRTKPAPRGAWQPPPPREKTPRRRRRGNASKEENADESSRRSKSAPARERPPAADPDEARSSEAPAALGGADRAPTLIDRRIERSARAAAARAAAEKLRAAEAERVEKAAEAKRLAAKRLRERQTKVAFGRKVDAERDAEEDGAPSESPASAKTSKSKAKSERPRNTVVKPFNLSVGNAKRPDLEDRENARRDPDVWEPSPERKNRRPLSETFAEADARREAEREVRDSRRASAAATRRSKIVVEASRAAAPAIAAAEAARREATIAAMAAAKAAEAAEAAEALMMAEARRLRERRAELYAAGKAPEFVSARAFEGASRAGFEDDDDATPLMASYGEMRVSRGDVVVEGAPPEEATFRDAAPRRGSSRRFDDARDESEPTDEPVASPSPEKPRGDDGDAPSPPMRVSASLATPSPIKAPRSPAVERALREPVQYEASRLRADGDDGGDDGAADGDDDDDDGDDLDGTVPRRASEDADALAARLAAQLPGTPAGTSRRRQVRVADDDGPPSPETPPSPASPAVTWRAGRRELPAALRQTLFPVEGVAASENPPVITRTEGIVAAVANDAETMANDAETMANDAETKTNVGVEPEEDAARRARGHRVASHRRTRVIPETAIRAAEAREAALRARENDAEGTGADSNRGADAASGSSLVSSHPPRGVASGRHQLLRGDDLLYVPPANLATLADDDEDDDEDDGHDVSSRTSLLDRTDATDATMDLTTDATAAIAAANAARYYAEKSHPAHREAAVAAAAAAAEMDASEEEESFEESEEECE